ncbi:ferritin family protein [Pontiellaceae bacterium B12227]|nr:ferritin family protein [Pontiellaceae bacterium B12227]
MKTNRLDELIDESIQLELNAAELYRVFAESLNEDADFWLQISKEEKHHAMLLRSAKESFVKRGNFPRDLVSDSIELLLLSNLKLQALIAKFKAFPPTRIEACETALALERDVGESHYTKFMEKKPDSAIDSVFQTLNKGDKAHERRISAHFESLLAIEPQREPKPL